MGKPRRHSPGHTTESRSTPGRVAGERLSASPKVSMHCRDSVRAPEGERQRGDKCGALRWGDDHAMVLTTDPGWHSRVAAMS